MKSTKAVLKAVEKKSIHHPLEFLLGKIKTASEANDQSLLTVFCNIYKSKVCCFAFQKLTPIVKSEYSTRLDRIIVTHSTDGTKI